MLPKGGHISKVQQHVYYVCTYAFNVPGNGGLCRQVVITKRWFSEVHILDDSMWATQLLYVRRLTVQKMCTYVCTHMYARTYVHTVLSVIILTMSGRSSVGRSSVVLQS